MSRFDVHQTGDGRFLQRIGSHRHLIPAERLARPLSARRMTDQIEERPVFGSRLEDLHELRLETYFRNRFPEWIRPADWTSTLLVVRHVIIFGYGHGLQRAIIDESQHRTPERLIMAQH